MSDNGISLRSLHRPLVVLTGAMAVLCVVALVGLLVDGRTIVNAPIWLKPFKFTVSIGSYAITLALLLTRVRRGSRVGWWLGTLFTVGIGTDMALIVFQMIFRGRQLHFNKATPADIAINNVVAGGAYLAWLSIAAVVVLLLFQRMPDRALNSALRWGTGLSLAGMAVAMLMFSPTPEQHAVLQEGKKPPTFGAHSVGASDGGPGLPLLGWSTQGGDLRIPHFVGIHAIQVLPLIALGLIVLARRYPLLRSDVRRRWVVRIAVFGYTGVFAILTWQAMRGQSVVNPDVRTLLAAAAVVAVTVALTVLALRAREAGPLGENRDARGTSRDREPVPADFRERR
ncbi:hypothetical protein ACFOWZ_28650 [Lentzea rhizosphaerae]|uniref:Uncharacterized protein n=1 Tax=Lentzea rhizosphaerae TaxID=2041025 RepID=A0ABV8C0P7_9PSEU